VELGGHGLGPQGCSACPSRHAMVPASGFSKPTMSLMVVSCPPFGAEKAEDLAGPDGQGQASTLDLACCSFWIRRGCRSSLGSSPRLYTTDRRRGSADRARLTSRRRLPILETHSAGFYDSRRVSVMDSRPILNVKSLKERSTNISASRCGRGACARLDHRHGRDVRTPGRQQTPLRDALLLLETKALSPSCPGARSFVNPLTLQEIRISTKILGAWRHGLSAAFGRSAPWSWPHGNPQLEMKQAIDRNDFDLTTRRTWPS